MKIVLSGGNGYLGRGLASRWAAAGWEVVVLTRSPGAQARHPHHKGRTTQAGPLHHKSATGAARGDARPPGTGEQAGPLHQNFREVCWDGRTLGEWASEIDGADVLVNLAGRSVNCRYNDFNKGVILSSRVDSTRVLGEAVAQCVRPPRVWLNSSTATIYRHAEASADQVLGRSA